MIFAILNITPNQHTFIQRLGQGDVWFVDTGPDRNGYVNQVKRVTVTMRNHIEALPKPRKLSDLTSRVITTNDELRVGANRAVAFIAKDELELATMVMQYLDK